MYNDFSKFKSRKADFYAMDKSKYYSVFVPILRKDDTEFMIFEVRSAKLSRQPNELCFPGGKIELNESKQQAAIRETSEELLLDQENIIIIGELDTVVTPFNTILYPFIGYINNYNNTYSTNEVKEIIYIPFDYFVNTPPLYHSINVEMKPKADFPFDMIQEGKNYPWAMGSYPVYFYNYKGTIIWGITARIIYNFIQIFNDSNIRK